MSKWSGCLPFMVGLVLILGGAGKYLYANFETFLQVLESLPAGSFFGAGLLIILYALVLPRFANILHGAKEQLRRTTKRGVSITAAGVFTLLIALAVGYFGDIVFLLNGLISLMPGYLGAVGLVLTVFGVLILTTVQLWKLVRSIPKVPHYVGRLAGWIVVRVARFRNWWDETLKLWRNTRKRED